MPTSVKIAAAEVFGFLFLWIPCLLKAWTPPIVPSIVPLPNYDKPGPHRPLVDRWKWNWLNRWYGNIEDGVSGQQAWILNPGLTWYPSTFPSWVPQCAVAFAWSVWRNGANNLKRPFENVPQQKP